MPNLLTDPSFENGTGWLYANGAERTTDYGALDGTYTVAMPFVETPFSAAVARQQVTLNTDRAYVFSVWTKRIVDGAAGMVLEWDPTPGGPEILDSISRSAATGFWQRLAGVVVPTVSTGNIQIRIAQDGSGQDATWIIDSAEVRMAVKLAERAVDAIVTSMVANLATELTAIDTDRGDGVTLAAPASADYHKYEKAEIAGNVVQVEVFEDDFNFDNPYSDSDAQRAVYSIPITIRLTCFNRNGDNAATMHKRKRRYAAGLFSVINKNPQLVSPVDDALQIAVVEAVQTEIDRDAEDNISKVRATLRCLVSCEEVQT